MHFYISFQKMIFFYIIQFAELSDLTLSPTKPPNLFELPLYVTAFSVFSVCRLPLKKLFRNLLIRFITYFLNTRESIQNRPHQSSPQAYDFKRKGFKFLNRIAVCVHFSCLFYVATYAVFGGIKLKFHASVNCAFMLKVY